MTNKYDLLILYSGGVDSLFCLNLATSGGYKPFVLMIDYEQLHKDELKIAKKYLREMNYLQHSQIVQIKNLNINSGLTNGKKSLYENENEMYVPSRNMMFVSIAASIAENKNIHTIWYGADLSDSEDNFSDCKQDWIIKMNNLLKINGSYPIKLESPTLGLSKDSIEQMMKSVMNENFDKNVYSGYGEFA